MIPAPAEVTFGRSVARHFSLGVVRSSSA